MFKVEVGQRFIKPDTGHVWEVTAIAFDNNILSRAVILKNISEKGRTLLITATCLRDWGQEEPRKI